MLGKIAFIILFDGRLGPHASQLYHHSWACWAQMTTKSLEREICSCCCCCFVRILAAGSLVCLVLFFQFEKHMHSKVHPSISPHYTYSPILFNYSRIALCIRSTDMVYGSGSVCSASVCVQWTLSATISANCQCMAVAHHLQLLTTTTT